VRDGQGGISLLGEEQSIIMKFEKNAEPIENDDRI
jgi:hypothetical protein